MTFLAPWALALGLLAATGAVLLHLVSRQRPAAFLLPTARFIPDQRTLVRRLASRPRDLLLLALRVIVLLAASAAFAQPVLAPSRKARARLVLLDRSAAVADPPAALARVRALAGDGAPTRLVLFDSVAVAAGGASGDVLATLDSLARATGRVDPSAATHGRDRGADAGAARAAARAPAGSLSAALVAARRLAPSLAREADSVELVLVSPVLAAQVDAATRAVRAAWPGAMRIERLPARTAAAPRWSLERAIGPDDPLGPALAGLPVGAGPAAVRLRRGALGAEDSAVARAGRVVIAWDELARAPVRAQALVAGDDVVVAPLRRGDLRAGDGERALARWADGAPAALEARLGAGCLRRIAIGIPDAGDLPLRPAFQRLVRGLMAPCGGGPAAGPRVERLADDATLAWLAGADARAATGEALEGLGARRSAIVPWLLGIALAAALMELLVRARSRAPEGA